MGNRQPATAVTNRVIYTPRAYIGDGRERRIDRHQRRHGLKWRQRGQSDPPTSAVEDKGMAVLENTDTETQHATDNLLAPQIEERNQGEEVPPAIEKMSSPDPQEYEAGDIQDRRRQTLSDGHSQPSRDEVEGKMEIYDEQQPVRRRPGRGENKKTPGRT